MAVAGFLRRKILQIAMKRIKRRDDLMSKSEYSKQYNINRVKVDEMINSGKLSVEQISGVDYIKIK